MQAIETRYFGPGNVRGSRVKATAEAGSIILSWNDSLNADQNHASACRALCDKFGWKGNYARGDFKNQVVWVCFDHRFADEHVSIPRV